MEQEKNDKSYKFVKVVVAGGLALLILLSFVGGCVNKNEEIKKLNNEISSLEEEARNYMYIANENEKLKRMQQEDAEAYEEKAEEYVKNAEEYERVLHEVSEKLSEIEDFYGWDIAVKITRVSNYDPMLKQESDELIHSQMRYLKIYYSVLYCDYTQPLYLDIINPYGDLEQYYPNPVEHTFEIEGGRDVGTHTRVWGGETESWYLPGYYTILMYYGDRVVAAERVYIQEDIGNEGNEA